MYGIILAGGTGSRMGLYTQRVGNKHLMPVYDKVMIEFPINTLVNAGIKNITIVTGNRYSGQFVDFLGDGKEWGIEHVSYAYQFGEGGIADALKCAYSSVPKDESIAVILGDNIFENNFAKLIHLVDINPMWACIFTKKVKDPERFGVYSFYHNKIIEKPVCYVGDMAVTGLYLYPYDVFEKIKTLKPSKRGELEITDINNMYIKKKKFHLISIPGFWHDAGTPESLLECTIWRKNQRNNVKEE